MLNRRRFILTVLPALGAGLLASRYVQAQANKVGESEPTAIALGYKENAARVDAQKFAAYKPGSQCANCQQFQGKAGDAWASCSIFGGKQVSAAGWCSAWVRKG